MAEVRTYLTTSGTQATRSLTRIDADRVALDWRRVGDGKLISRELLSNAEAVNLGAGVTAFMAAPVPSATLAAPVLTGTAGDGSIDLAWTVASGSVKRFEVWLNNAWAAQLTPDVRSWRKTGLVNGTPVSARVVAYDDSGLKNSNTITLTPAGAAPAAGFRFNTLVFEDDFATLDLAKWSLYDGQGHAGNGLRDPKCWAVGSADGANGNALIGTAFWDAAVGKIRAPGMSCRKLGILHGRFEVRMRTEVDPSGVTASNFLTWPDDGIWPAHGENNVWETTGRGNATRSPMMSYIHYGAANSQKSFEHPVSGADWHTVAMEWAENRIDIWRDGALVWSMTDKAAIPTWPHHACLQLDALANRDPGKPIRVYYDHVRIYE